MSYGKAPLYFSTDEDIRSAKNPFYTGLKESAKRIYKSAGFTLFKNILVLIVLTFVFIACILNLVAFAKIKDDYSTDRDNYNNYVGNNPTVTPKPPIPVESVSEGWLLFGIVGNSLIALLALVGMVMTIIDMVKGNKTNEKGVRKIIKQTVAGVRVQVENAVEKAINKIDLDMEDLDKPELISNLKMKIDTSLDKYLGNVMDNIDTDE